MTADDANVRAVERAREERERYPVQFVTVNGQWMPQGTLGHEMGLQLRDALARVEVAEAALARVKALHEGTHWCFSEDRGDEVFEPGTSYWPCPTFAALAAEPTPAAEPHAQDGPPEWWDADHNRPADIYCPPERQFCKRCGFGRLAHDSNFVTGDITCRPAPVADPSGNEGGEE